MRTKLNEVEIIRQKAINLINYAKDETIEYNAMDFESGYHSITLAGKEYKGQRDNLWRLKDIPFDFTDKNVLDIGCNAGGILHNLSDKITYGMGIDYNSKLINAANMIKSINQEHNLNFYIFDLEKVNLNIIKEMYLAKTIDVIFLLSVCMWLENWRDIIDFCESNSPASIFETNGSKEQQKEQITYLGQKYKNIQLVYQSSLDDKLQSYRMMLFCN